MLRDPQLTLGNVRWAQYLLSSLSSLALAIQPLWITGHGSFPMRVSLMAPFHPLCARSHACPPLCFTRCTLPASPCTHHACPHPFLSFFGFIFTSTTQQPTCFRPLCLGAFLCTHPPVPAPGCSCLCSFRACSRTCLPLCFRLLHLACFPLRPPHLCSPLPMVSFSFFFLLTSATRPPTYIEIYLD